MPQHQDSPSAQTRQGLSQTTTVQGRTSGPTPEASAGCPEFLDTKEAANFLRCTVDRVYRTPSDMLPRYRSLGKKVLFHIDDLRGLILSRRDSSTHDLVMARRATDELARSIRNGRVGRTNRVATFDQREAAND